MKILHIDPTTQNINEFNNYIKKENQHAFVIFYMVGCGPCEMARPEWKNIDNVLDDKTKKDDILIVDINQEILRNPDLKIAYLKENNISINGFPTIHYITNKGNVVEEYDGQRTADSFKKWIESKVINSKQNKASHKHMTGGKRKYTKKNSNRRTRYKKNKRSKKAKKHYK
jgi:vacuolar-type H+-ATPase subunit F/Vma7